MGWTGYFDITAQEAIALELRGTEVLARSGNWVVWRNTSGHVGLTYFLTRRHGHEVAVKAVDITMGPGKVPPKSVARVYLEAYDGDAQAAGGKYGADLLREAVTRKAAIKAVPGHTTFTIPEDKYVSTWSDGVAFAGEYVWLGKYRARRMVDGQVVRLPRNWRRRWLAA